jgi:hypothetical protein
VKLFRLNSALGKLTSCLSRLVAKSRDFELLLTGLSTKPSELPVGCGRLFRHKLKGTERPQLALGKEAEHSRPGRAGWWGGSAC